jgi:hypothetical protein
MAWQCTSPGSGEKGIFLRNGYNNIQELRSSSRNSFRHALELYGLLQDGQLHQQKFKDSLDIIVDAELDLFVYQIEAQQKFQDDRDWHGIEQARRVCRDNTLQYAEKIETIAQYIGHASDDYVRDLFNRQILLPLGLEMPQYPPHKY